MKEIAGFNCRLVHQKRKSMRVTVSANGQINVYVPKRTPLATVTKFVESRKSFIREAVKKQQGNHNSGLFGDPTEAPFLYYMGNKLPVIFGENQPPILTRDGFYLPCDLSMDQYRDIITELYRPIATEYITARAEAISREVSIPYGKLRFARSISRWGSCSSSGTVSFSVYLIAVPPECIDHVIMHELAHKKEMNHSIRFYNVLGKMESDHRELQAQLKQYSKWVRKFKPTAS